MRTITLLLMLAVTCPVPYALSQDDRRGIPARVALERIASSHGAAIIEKIVEMKGRRGQSQPREWWIVVRDERSSSRLRTMWVGDERATDEGENKEFYPKLIPLGFIPDKKLKVDSPAAFNILIREATAARVGFDSVDYKLRSMEFSDEPVWSLTAKDVRGNVVGKVMLSGSDGRVYRKVWYYRQPGGHLRIVDSALDAPGKPEVPRQLDPGRTGSPRIRIPEFLPGPDDPGTEQAEIEAIRPE
jgi:hypothetical protein